MALRRRKILKNCISIISIMIMIMNMIMYMIIMPCGIYGVYGIRIKLRAGQ